MPITPGDAPLYTTREAASLLGLTPSALRSAIANGVLRALRIDERTNLISEDEIERYRRENLGRRGRPKKDRTKDGTP
jgi:excisionase family DNA binding protein